MLSPLTDEQRSTLASAMEEIAFEDGESLGLQPLARRVAASSHGGDLILMVAISRDLLPTAHCPLPTALRRVRRLDG